MRKSIIVAKVPNEYTLEQKKELENAISYAVNEYKPLIIPDEVEVFSLPLEN